MTEYIHNSVVTDNERDTNPEFLKHSSVYQPSN